MYQKQFDLNHWQFEEWLFSNEMLLMSDLRSFQNFQDQNMLDRDESLLDDLYLYVNVLYFPFWSLPFEYKTNNWRINCNYHPWKALAFQELLFSSIHHTSPCLSPLGRHCFSKFRSMGILAALNIIELFFSKCSLFKIEAQCIFSRNLYFG